MNSKRSLLGCPIRESSGQSVIPALRSVSSVSTPFIVFGCLGIHHKPFFFRELKSIVRSRFYPQHKSSIHCGGKRTRTADICLAKAALYQLSYTPRRNSKREKGKSFLSDLFLLGYPGFEPGTSPLSGVRSYQLS